MSVLRQRNGRDDAAERVHFLPRLRGLRRDAAAEAWRLLRFLFVRLGSVSADPAGPAML
jgi:hypothetical protein